MPDAAALEPLADADALGFAPAIPVFFAVAEPFTLDELLTETAALLPPPLETGFTGVVTFLPPPLETTRFVPAPLVFLVAISYQPFLFCYFFVTRQLFFCLCYFTL